MNVAFGYFPDPLDFAEGSISVKTLPNLHENRSAVEASGLIYRKWIHAPQSTGMTTEGGRQILPFASRVFALPKTHEFSHLGATSADHLSFLVWVLGFLLGVRLTDTEAGFLDAAPILPGALHDILWLHDEYRIAIGLADRFWMLHGPETSKGLVGVLNALFLSQRPHLLGFEQFIYIYSAMDACYAVWAKIAGKSRSGISHSKRLAHLCADLGTLTPSWVGKIAADRNATLHEALFFGEPLGFAVYGGNASATQASGNTVLEMQNLVTRFICSLLKLPCLAYIRSPVDTRNIIGVEFR